jgi:hypothetical protein
MVGKSYSGMAIPITSVGAGKYRLRDRHAELVCALQVQHQLELGRLLDRQIRRFRASQDAVHVISQAPVRFAKVRAVCAHRTALREDSPAGNQRHLAAQLKIDDAVAVLHGEGIGKHRDRLGRLGRHRVKRGGQFFDAARREVGDCRVETPCRLFGGG